MHAYRVIGSGFTVGIGALLILSAAQAADRGRKVEPVIDDEAFGLYKAVDLQQFKTGELLGLDDAPKGQGHLLELIPVGSKLKKEDPAKSLLQAISIFNDKAEEAELQRQLDIEAAEKKHLADMQRRRDEADAKDWTEEWTSTEAIKAKYPKVDDYVAARKAERDKTATLV